MSAPERSSPGMPSFRTFAMATTNSPPILHQSYVSRRPSMSSLKQCDPDQQSDSTGLRSNNATKPPQFIDKVREPALSMLPATSNSGIMSKFLRSSLGY